MYLTEQLSALQKKLDSIINLVEGGNIFQNTADFDQKIIPDMMKQINNVMKVTGAKALPIG